MKKNALSNFLIALALCLLPTLVFGQSDSSVEMADAMRSNGKIYVVVALLSLVFLGVAFYLFVLDRKVKKMEEEFYE